MKDLDQNTRITIGVAIAVFGGGAGWMTSIALQANANAKSLESIEARQIQYSNTVQNIEKDLGIIKYRIEEISKYFDQKQK